jgi:hypothetical protein
MSEQIKRWLPIALCCVPGIAIAAIVGIGIVFGGAAFGASFGGPLGIGVIVLAALACPLSMGLMMMRGMKQNSATGSAQMMADCCAPNQASVSVDTSLSADSLSALRSRREALEREIAELQSN